MLAGAYSEQKHKWKKTTTTTTLEKKIKLDAVREHQRVHNHREFIVTFRFGSAFKRRVLIERKKRGRERIEWTKKLCGSVCGREFAVVRTMRWVRNRISIRNLNKNAIKTDTAGRNFFNQITRFIERTIATAAHIIFVCKLTIARVSVCECVWVRVWQNSFLLPFSLLFLFSLFSIGLIYLWPQHQSAVLCGEQWTCDAVCPTDKIIFLYLLFVFAWAKCTTALAHTHTHTPCGWSLFV